MFRSLYRIMLAVQPCFQETAPEGGGVLQTRVQVIIGHISKAGWSSASRLPILASFCVNMGPPEVAQPINTVWSQTYRYM